MSEPIRIWNDKLGPGGYGTLGCLVRRGGRLAVLTAAHVVSPLWLGVHQSRFRDVTIGAGSRIVRGTMDRWTMPLDSFGNRSPDAPDAALVYVDTSDEEALARAATLPSGLSACAEGDQVFFIGATTRRLLKSTLQDRSAPVVMRYGVFQAMGQPQQRTASVVIQSTIQVDATLLTRPGDSGGLLFDRDGGAVGLLIGTDPDDVYPHFCPLADVLDQFGVTLLTHQDFPGQPRLEALIDT